MPSHAERAKHAALSQVESLARDLDEKDKMWQEAQTRLGTTTPAVGGAWKEIYCCACSLWA